jgi:outer membrane protein
MWRKIERALLVLLVIVAAVQLPATADTSSPGAQLSLPDIIHIALARNPQIAAAQHDIETAERKVNVNRAKSLPVLAIDTDYEYLPRRAIINPLVMTPEIMVPTSEGGVAGLSLTLPLYTGGRIPLQVRISELGALSEQHQLDATRQDITFNLSSLYYTTLRLEAAVRATQTSLAGLQSAKSVVSEFVKVGREPRVDLLRVDARVAEVSADLVSLQNARAVTLASIETLMGFPAETPLEVKGGLGSLPSGAASGPLDVSSLVAQALRSRPEYLTLLAQEQAQEERVRLARAAYLPNLSLVARYGVQSADALQSGGSISEGVSRVMLVASIPVYDETLHQGTAVEESSLAALRSRVDQLRLSIGLEVQKAAVAVRDQAAQVSAAEAGLAQADEALRIEQLKLRLGKGIVTDVLQAQADSLRSRLQYTAALAGYRTALVQLSLATGTLQVPSGGGD